MNSYPPPLSDIARNYLEYQRAFITQQYGTSNEEIQLESEFLCREKERTAPFDYQGPADEIRKLVAPIFDELRLLANNSAINRKIFWKVSVKDPKSELVKFIQQTISARKRDLVVQYLEFNDSMCHILLRKLPDNSESKQDKSAVI